MSKQERIKLLSVWREKYASVSSRVVSFFVAYFMVIYGYFFGALNYEVTRCLGFIPFVLDNNWIIFIIERRTLCTSRGRCSAKKLKTMGFRFYRRIKILPGITLNLSKQGISFSFGTRGANLTFGKSGVRKTVGLPGTGMNYSSHSSWDSLRSLWRKKTWTPAYCLTCHNGRIVGYYRDWAAGSIHDDRWLVKPAKSAISSRKTGFHETSGSQSKEKAILHQKGSCIESMIFMFMK